MNTSDGFIAGVFIWMLTIYLSQSQKMGELCSLNTGLSGKCIKLRDCKTALAKIRKGERPKICNFVQKHPIICCEDDTRQNNTEPIRVLPGFMAKQKCKEYLEEKKPVEEDTNHYIQAVNGIRARSKEFVHMAAVGFESGNEIMWLCGGSLISDRFVLSAAHCVSSLDYGNAKWIRLGDLDLERDTDDARPANYTIIRSIIHPKYVRKTKQNDIALFELSRPATMSEYVKPACLHTEDNIEGSLSATGWGLTDYAGVPSAHLIKVYLEEFNYSRCYELYPKQGIDSKTQLCVGSSAEKAMDTCKGDSGGPLQIKHPVYEKYYIVVGVTSFGKGCGIQNVPAVYIKVSQFVPWIEDIVWPQ